MCIALLSGLSFGAKFRLGPALNEIHCNCNIGFAFCFWCVCRKYFLPEGLAKEPLQVLKNPKCLDLIDCTMVLLISACKINATITTDAFKRVPTCFEGPRGRKIGFTDPGPDRIKFSIFWLVLEGVQ